MKFIKTLGFLPKENSTNVYYKKYSSHEDYVIEIDIAQKRIDFGSKIFFNDSKNSQQNITKPEDNVVLECVDRLLEKGYKPQNIVLEKRWEAGHGHSGRLDILVTHDDGSAYMMLECKTWGKEYDKAFAKLQKDGGQLFTYFRFDTQAEILVLYSSRFHNNKIEYTNQIIKIEEEHRATSNVKDFYDRWNKLSKNNGVFESYSSVYEFISKALTKNDLKVLREDDSSFIFNRFLEILRHNVVSDKPNAFNKIFTLFLCKIIDEDRADDEQLHFQWLEGEDTHISFQKRLADLYNRGMNELLEKQVTDISDNEFEKQFQQVDEEYKAKFKEILTEVRLKKNNEFAIKEVYDNDSFNDNAIVVKEIVELLQIYQIRYNYRQQFLSDFFELLLTTGLKQESGQFFTPVPLARFIIKSMPITQIVERKVSKGDKTNLLPMVIDYAAGSGHFITESMEEIQNYIDTIDESTLTPTTKRAIKKWKADPFDWAEDYVYAIERDYRLVKTAKVSCYLHGDGLAKVIHGDGLADFRSAKEYKDRLTITDKTYLQDNKQFDVLISNPPYSVSSFKSMMDSEKSKENFELFSRLTDQSSEIETLFIERTKQLLKDGGVAGIILPSSILSNTGIYTQSREIILDYFDIVSIVELGSNTFMATGTNTVILFLRRKNNVDHLNYKASVEKLFNNKKDITINGIENPLQKYLSHIWEGIGTDDYLTLFDETPSDKLIAHEIMKSYMGKFKGSVSEQLNQIIKLEKEKLYYFIVAYLQKVTLVKTGDKKEEKQFLGYEFSHRRGSEGIHSTQRGKSIDECTSLYDENSYDNAFKANSYIYGAFNGEFKEIDERLKKNISYIDLVDMMTFDRVDFDKNISLSVKKKVKVESRWDIVLLGDKIEILDSKRIPLSTRDRKTGKYPYYGATGIIDYIDEYIFEETLVLIGEDGAKWEANENSAFIAEGQYWVNNHAHVLKPNRKELLDKYLIEVLNMSDLSEYITGLNVPKLNQKNLKNIKIPLPPIDIQKKIVEEIEKLEKLNDEYLEAIKSLRSEISIVVDEVESSLISLKEITSKIGSGATPRGGESAYKKSGISLIRSQNIYDAGMVKKGLVYIDNQQAEKLKNATVEKNDILFNITGASVARCCLVEKLYLPARVNQHVAIIRTNEKALSKYVQMILVSKPYKKKLLEVASGGTSREAITKVQLEEFKIPLPIIEEQLVIVSKIEALEKKIAELEEQLVAIPSQKEAILKKYL